MYRLKNNRKYSIQQNNRKMPLTTADVVNARRSPLHLAPEKAAHTADERNDRSQHHAFD